MHNVKDFEAVSRKAATKTAFGMPGTAARSSAITGELIVILQIFFLWMVLFFFNCIHVAVNGTNATRSVRFPD